MGQVMHVLGWIFAIGGVILFALLALGIWLGADAQPPRRPTRVVAPPRPVVRPSDIDDDYWATIARLRVLEVEAERRLSELRRDYR